MNNDNCLSVLFDVDDTLYDQLDVFRAAFDEAFGGEYDADISDLYVKSRRYGEEIFKLVEKGEKTLEESFIYRLQMPMRDYGYEITDVRALEFQNIYVKKQDEIRLTPNMKAVLDFCIRRNLKTGVITNGVSQGQWNKIHNLGIEKWIKKENIFVSGDINLSKPNTDVFRYVEKKMGLTPQNTYYIGDSLDNDVIGTHNAGWNMIWLNKRNVELKDKSVEPLYTLYDDGEVLDTLKKIVG